MMCHHWLLITFSWIGTARLQYINTGGPGAESVLNNLDPTLHYSLPYVNFFSQPHDADTNPSEISPEYFHDEEVQRKRRTTDDQEQRHWVPNLVDMDKTSYIKNGEIPTPFEYDSDNGTVVEKRSFSPWGGKRDTPIFEHMWTWKRSSAVREPSMPKRVRFSPWGGKRSGQMIYKPGTKNSKVIFSSSIPELTRIVSYYSPNEEYQVTGFQIVPGIDKRNPIKTLALSTNMDDRRMRKALPFKTFMEAMPKLFKPGHPYHDVQSKKDESKKKIVPFKIWGGKRSPPIIGPIWTPAPQDIKESTLNTILLIRNTQDEKPTTS